MKVEKGGGKGRANEAQVVWGGVAGRWLQAGGHADCMLGGGHLSLGSPVDHLPTYLCGLPCGVPGRGFAEHTAQHSKQCAGVGRCRWRTAAIGPLTGSAATQASSVLLPAFRYISGAYISTYLTTIPPLTCKSPPRELCRHLQTARWRPAALRIAGRQAQAGRQTQAEGVGRWVGCRGRSAAVLPSAPGQCCRQVHWVVHCVGPRR